MTAATQIPRIGRDEAAALADVEYRRLVDLLGGLDEASWAAPTDCPGWSVRDMTAHVLGALEAGASMREQVHQMRDARRLDLPLVDALGVVQIRDRARCTPAELVRRLTDAIEPGVRGRRRVPAPMRALPIRFAMPWGVERVRLRDLLDTILLRDAWMHRVDLARATGSDFVLTGDHDGRIVADVVGEWARRHGAPFRLVLDGVAGGQFEEGEDGPVLELDAVDFCRIVAGRAEGAGLLTQEVVF